MIQQWSGGKEKIKVANEIILRIMDSVYAVNPNVEFSLRVFGNQHTVEEHDCTDTRNEVPFSKFNKTQMEFRLEDLHPLGITSIAYSLNEAAEKDLVDEKRNAYSIILITDGGESCGGDICAIMRKLENKKIFFRPYIINLEDVPELKKEYACMGEYLQVTKKSDFNPAITKIVDAFKPMLKLSKAEYSTIRTTPQPIIKNDGGTTKVVKPTLSADTPVVAKKTIRDTVKPEKPAEIKHSITVGEEKKKPEPAKLTKARTTGMGMLRVDPIKLKKAKTVALIEPNVATPEVEIPQNLKAAAMTSAPVKKLKRLKVKMPEIAGTQLVTPDYPNVKGPELPTPPKPADLTAAPVRKLKKMKVAAPDLGKPYLVTIKEPGVKYVEPTPVKPAEMAKVSLPVASKLAVNSVKISKSKTFKISYKPIAFEDPEPYRAPEKPKVALAKLKLPKFKMHLLYGGTFLDYEAKPVKIAPPPHIEYPKAQPASPVATQTKTPDPKKNENPVKPPVKPVEKTGKYSVEHEDAPETTLEVYLTNGKGKFYTTTPEVVIFEKGTNKQVKKFHRFVDPSGNPDPITDLAIGNYDLTITGRDDLLAHVELQAHKHNKVYIEVKNYSLYFRYLNNPKRDVSEYQAEVIQRNVANGKVVIQKCTEKLEYEPGNYHILVNTFPESIFNIDLDMDAAGAITIPEPGFVTFVPEVNTTSVTLWKQSGERFINFKKLDITDPSNKKKMILPGKYQVQYSTGETNFSSSNRVITFEISSNKETQVILKK